jgi:hypothetical protein
MRKQGERDVVVVDGRKIPRLVAGVVRQRGSFPSNADDVCESALVLVLAAYILRQLVAIAA